MENDIVFIPSKTFESFSMVFLEALMNARPCICYQNIATAELIMDNKTGWVINDKKGSLTAKLEELINLGPDKLSEISKNCRNSFLNSFTSDIMNKKYQEI